MHRERARRFLRPRGDAPYREYLAPPAPWVPPPTRRCTRRPQPLQRSHEGSSAHAEMHRVRRDTTRTSSGFLRPRGDAPRDHRSRHAEEAVPPPTRRCTLALRDAGPRSTGSSAHAEMHPSTRNPRRLSGGFLRPRGDAPEHPKPAKAFRGVPPPTRRCTRVHRTRGDHRAGSSAHAEMHRSPEGSPSSRTRFLRPRGDAPAWDWLAVEPTRVPPPTRRCTLDPPVVLSRRVGSSAHAEMHLNLAIDPGTRARFLRPRGDAPLIACPLALLFTVPPPTRRCTPRLLVLHERAAGSSAHAEMHRARRATRRSSRRFLRPRGDAPRHVGHKRI